MIMLLVLDVKLIPNPVQLPPQPARIIRLCFAQHFYKPCPEREI